MHKFFDYLAPDLPVKTIGELAGYIRRFAALFSGGVPVEGHMGGVAFCATEQPGGGVRVHWVQVVSKSGTITISPLFGELLSSNPISTLS